MKLNQNGLPAKLLKRLVEKEKRDNRRRPAMLFVGERWTGSRPRGRRPERTGPETTVCYV